MSLIFLYFLILFLFLFLLLFLFISILFYSIPFRSVPLRSAPLRSTPLHSTPLHSTPLHSTPLHSTLLYSTLLYSTLLYSTLLYSTLLYSILSLTELSIHFLVSEKVYFKSQKTVWAYTSNWTLLEHFRILVLWASGYYTRLKKTQISHFQAILGHPKWSKIYQYWDVTGSKTLSELFELQMFMSPILWIINQDFPLLLR